VPKASWPNFHTGVADRVGEKLKRGKWRAVVAYFAFAACVAIRRLLSVEDRAFPICVAGVAGLSALIGDQGSSPLER